MAYTPPAIPVTFDDPLYGTWYENGVRHGANCQLGKWVPSGIPGGAPTFIPASNLTQPTGALYAPDSWYASFPSYPLAANIVTAAIWDGTPTPVAMTLRATSKTTGTKFCPFYNGDVSLIELETPGPVYYKVQGAVTNAPVLTIIGWTTDGVRAKESVTLTNGAGNNFANTYKYVVGCYITGTDPQFATSIAIATSTALAATVDPLANMSNICPPQDPNTNGTNPSFADDTAYRLNFIASRLDTTTFPGVTAIELDVPRCLSFTGVASGGGTTSVPISVAGADLLKQLTSETVTGPAGATTTTSKKAYKWLFSLTANADTVSTLSCGLSNTFGLPYYCAQEAYLSDVSYGTGDVTGATVGGSCSTPAAAVAGALTGSTVTAANVAGALTGSTVTAANVAGALTGSTVTAANIQAALTGTALTSGNIATYTLGSAVTGGVYSMENQPSSLVKVNQTGHGLSTGQWVYVSTVSAGVTGLTAAQINIAAMITRVDADNFTYVAAGLATANGNFTDGQYQVITPAVATGITLAGVTAAPVTFGTGTAAPVTFGTGTAAPVTFGTGTAAAGTIAGTVTGGASVTFLPGDRTFATLTTGDVRGTIGVPAATSNASIPLTIVQQIPGMIWPSQIYEVQRGEINYPANAG